MDLTTSLDELARSTTKVFVDGSIISTDYNGADFPKESPDFAEHIGAKSRVKRRCGGSFGYRGIRFSYLNRQSSHTNAFASFVRNNSHFTTTSDVVNEHHLLVTHLKRVLSTHEKGKQGTMEQKLRKCANSHHEINYLLRGRVNNPDWPELIDYIRDARLYSPRRNLFRKSKRVHYSHEDAGLVTAALMECFDTDARVAIIAQDFDIVNIALQLGEDIATRRLPESLGILYEAPLASLRVYFPSNTDWIPNHELQFMVDTKLNMSYRENAGDLPRIERLRI
jgi:hypothetical protein